MRKKLLLVILIGALAGGCVTSLIDVLMRNGQPFFAGMFGVIGGAAFAWIAGRQDPELVERMLQDFLDRIGTKKRDR